MKGQNRATQNGAEKYQRIFELAAVPLMEQDLSKLRRRTAELKEDRGFNLERYLTSCPEFLREAASLIEVTDVNQAAIRLFEADRKEELLGPLDPDQFSVANDAFRQTLLAIDKGEVNIEGVSEILTCKGNVRRVTVKSHIPASEGSTSPMIVGLVDVTEQARVEVDLRAAKELAESLINTANVMVVGLDLSGKVTIFNSAAERISGYTRAEMIGRDWFEAVVQPDDYAKVRKKFEEFTRHGDTDPFENRLLTRFGTERYISWQNSQIITDGRFAGTLSVGMDITERVRLERNLAAEQSLFTTLMKNLPDQIYFKDLHSRFTRISMSQARAIGIQDPSEAVGKTDADFYGADHALKALEDERMVIETGSPLVDIEELETYPDRPVSWAITSKMPLRDEQGKIVGTFGITHDITERKLLEARNQELAALVDSADDAIIGFDLDRRVTVWNRGAETMFGYTRNEMTGESTSILIAPELEEEARISREKVIRGGKITNQETVRVRKDGSRILVSITLSPIRDADGRTVGIASVARDITEQKVLEEHKNRIQRLESLATLAGGIAHRFNNLTTVIKSYVDLSRSAPNLPLRVASYLDAASVGVQKTVDIVDRMMALTGRSGTARPVRLDLLARDLLEANENRIKGEMITVENELTATEAVLADESRLMFVLGSLFGNALDSLLDRPQRRLIVRTGNTKGNVYFEVQDSGCGIPSTVLPQIFSPFFSAKGEWAPPGSPQARLKGVGLALAISSITVSEYGGRIDVESSEGVGSTFRVLLPLPKKDVT